MQGKKKTKQDRNHRVSLGEFQQKNTDVKRYKTKRKIYRSGCQQLSNSDGQSVPRSRSIWCFLTWVMTAWPANTIQGSHWGSEYINISISSDLSVCCVYSSTNNCSALLKSVHLTHWVPLHLVDCLHNVTHRGTVTLPTRMGMVVRAFLWAVWTTNSNPAQTEDSDLLPLGEISKLLGLRAKKLPPLLRRMIEGHTYSEHDLQIRL